MIHQLLIKLFVVIFVINVTALGIMYDNSSLGYLGLLNLLLLIAVLFQHRSSLKEITTPGKRTLFTPSVFFLICIWIGLFVWMTVDGSFWEYFHISKLLGSIGLGLFAYVASYVLFQMDNEDSGRKLFSRLLFGVLLLACLGRVGQMLGKVSGLGVFTELFSRAESGKVEIVKDAVAPKSGISIEDIVNKEPKDEIIPLVDEVEEEEIVIAKEKEIMTYGFLIPTIVERNDLGSSVGSYSFTNIAQESPLYNSFARARDLGMIGTDISPTWQVKCKNLMVIQGLAAGWDVSLSQGVFAGYWSEATARGLTNSCGNQEDLATTDYFGITP